VTPGQAEGGEGTRGALPAEELVHLDDRVDVLPGVGAKARTSLAETFGIVTIRDLLEHYPRRYQDAGEVLDLSQVREGEPATLLGEVLDWSTRRIPGRGKKRPLQIAEGRVRQASGATFTVTFFNQNWRANQLGPGTVAAFSGKVKRFQRSLQLASPDVQVLGKAGTWLGGDDDPATRLQHQRLLAIYPATEAWPSFKLANLIETALQRLVPAPDWLPVAWLDELDLLTLDDAIRGIHLPPDHATRKAARRRLVFDELLSLQLGLQWRRAHLESETVGLDNAPVTGGKADAFLLAMPFKPTGAQDRAFAEIADDLAAPRPMHRLLQGDVGSGKTVVAVWTLLNAIDHGRQAALMVPTEVLADQHGRTLTQLLAPLGVNVLDGIRVDVLTSSTPTTTKRRILGELLSGDLDLIVGTHALLEEGVRFRDLGVVVIDEQHRFGVSQRVQLKEKATPPPGAEGQEVLPDVLVMTATPIPRSLALTLYGDLDVTVLDELPPGREPITTQLITPLQEPRRAKLYNFVRQEAEAGRRAYVVCPLVEEGEVAATNVTDKHRELAEEIFPDLDVQLIHGRMRAGEKDQAMQRFRSGEAQVLVSTTVIEVGVDVPEATIMIIEDAERFGISQLHQLRGRVGRGGGTSYCVLFAGWSGGELSHDALRRLEAVAATTDGFELAETDLDIRGEGQLFGKAQSGMPDLKLARIQRDQKVIEVTRKRAREIVARDPHLSDPTHATLRAEVLRRYEGGLDDFAALETG
jgi:ATP-dependent DNA helicase RecG